MRINRVSLHSGMFSDPNGQFVYYDDHKLIVDNFEKRIAELEQRLAAAEAKIPKWIPVSEKLPDVGVLVLAMDSSYDFATAVRNKYEWYANAFGFTCYENNGDYERNPDRIGGNVIAWMLLPEAPEVNGEQ